MSVGLWVFIEGLSVGGFVSILKVGVVGTRVGKLLGLTITGALENTAHDI
jgi:hypothetical protein